MYCFTLLGGTHLAFVELWNTYLLPVIRYLIGPIIVGVVVYYLTNKRKIKEEKAKVLRQLHAH